MRALFCMVGSALGWVTISAGGTHAQFLFVPDKSAPVHRAAIYCTKHPKRFATQHRTAHAKWRGSIKDVVQLSMSMLALFHRSTFLRISRKLFLPTVLHSVAPAKFARLLSFFLSPSRLLDLRVFVSCSSVLVDIPILLRAHFVLLLVFLR